MRNTMMSKSELDFEAPLAQFEETDEYLIEATKCRKDCENNNLLTIPTTKKSCLITHLDNNNLNNNCQEKLDNCKNIITNLSLANNEDTFTETISGSLEDLVNTFDEKITKCFGNYEESVENLAPVQIRTQEEIMDDCQMWWTITGNFGNILPIDWSKTYTRKMHLPSLNLNTNSKKTNESFDTISSEEEENITNDLDMHTLILSGIQAETEPIKTAEEVLQEIDDMIMEDTLSDVSPINEVFEKGRDILRCPLQDEKLKNLNLVELNEIFIELEVLIKEFSETLIAELALRDELEYEKELKNSFISLLLSVQSKRRHYYVEKKKLIKNNTNNNQLNMTNRTTNDMSYIIESKYLTTVIPYNLNNGPPNNQGLQVLIKILKAINEDSPTVPTLLTDYILKVLCPN